MRKASCDIILSESSLNDLNRNTKAIITLSLEVLIVLYLQDGVW